MTPYRITIRDLLDHISKAIEPENEVVAMNARNRHFWELHGWRRDGRINVFDSYGSPVTTISMNSFITTDAANQYLAEIGFPRIHEKSEPKERERNKTDMSAIAPAEEMAGQAFQPGSWQAKAYAIGETWMLEQERQTGERPGQIAIAKYVEGELTNQGIKGARGKFLDRETIKREALKGITGRPKNGKK